MDELHSLKGKSTLSLTTDNNVAAKNILEKNYTVTVSENGLNVGIEGKESIPAINKALVEQGLKVYNLSPMQFNLEDMFMQTLNS